MRQPNENLKRVSMFLTKAQLTTLHEMARQIGSNASELVRGFINDGLRRKQKERQ